MNAAALLACLLVGAGVAMVVVGLLRRGRDRQRALAELLDLPYGEHDVPVEAITEQPSLVVGAVGVAGRMVARVDGEGRLSDVLEQARIPLRAGEYVLIAALGAVGASVLTAVITGQWLLGAGAGIAGVLTAKFLPQHKAARRRRAFEEQLPDALSL